MKKLFAVSVVFALLLVDELRAYGPDGHKIIGAIADQKLAGTPTGTRVAELLDGYTLQEASEILRESLANTRNLYYRGLKLLKEFLDGKAVLKRADESVALERKDAYRFES